MCREKDCESNRELGYDKLGVKRVDCVVKSSWVFFDYVVLHCEAQGSD